MGVLFSMVLQNSVVGAVFIVWILLFRQVTRNMTKFYVRILWLLLVVELLVPPIMDVPFYCARNLLEENRNFVVSELSQIAEMSEEIAAGVIDEESQIYDEDIRYTAGSNHSVKGDMTGVQWQKHFSSIKDGLYRDALCHARIQNEDLFADRIKQCGEGGYLCP